MTLSVPNKFFDNDSTIITLASNECGTMAQWKRTMVLLLAILAVLTIHSHSLSKLRRILDTNEEDMLQKKLKQAITELFSLKQQHAYLTERLKKSRRSRGPHLDYENVRRSIQFTTKELWLYVHHHLNMALKKSLKPEQIQSMLKEVADRKRSLLTYLEKLPTVDGYQKWRHNEAGSVGDLLQRRLRYLQNPPDCRLAKKLLCEADGCGLGCQQHHLVYCLIYAYASKRTLLLKSYDWKFLVENRVQAQLFHPISKTCTDIYNDTVLPWSAVTLHAKVLSLPILHHLKETVYPRFLPSFIPKDLAKRIARFNADPSSWWVGQMLKYILKPQREAQKTIHQTLLGIDLKSPTVGIHIRRTDKIQGEVSEAKCFDIDEYMTHVDDYYAQIEQHRNIDVRRVYLATDEPKVLEEAIARYPQYKFYSNFTRAKWAGTGIRMLPEAIVGTLVDVHMLVICDFVVCTFSSNVGRMIYELVQTYRLDAYTTVTSLDKNYYFTEGELHIRSAVMRNTNTRSSALEIGDTIILHNNKITSNGTVLRTHISGVFPWYKTVPNFPIHMFPEYKEVQIYADKRIP